MSDDLREAAQALLAKLDAGWFRPQEERDRLRAALAADSTPTDDDRWAPVRRAIDSDWVDDMRQHVERRLGVPDGDPAVLDDPAYQAVLDADRALETASDQIEQATAWCPAGGLCPALPVVRREPQRARPVDQVT